MARMIRAVVFDFDGVLADSEPLHLLPVPDGARRARHRRSSARSTTATTSASTTSRCSRRSASGAARLAGRRSRIGAILDEKTVVFDDIVLRRPRRALSRAAACVGRLAAALPLGIASGALRHEIAAILRRAGLDRLLPLHRRRGRDAASKPAPDPYRRAAELHGVPPGECVAIEDSRWGIESAEGGGAPCIGITHDLSGRRASPGADAIIDSLDEFTVDLTARGLAPWPSTS